METKTTAAKAASAGHGAARTAAGRNAGAVDESKLNEFMQKAVTDIGAAMSAALVLIGDRLGLYRALASVEPLVRSNLGA